MFQTSGVDKNELVQVLAQELDFFTAVLQFSEKFVDEVDKLSVTTLANMVTYRQEWIEKIQRLEEKRKNLSQIGSDEETKKYFQLISEAAKKLVVIDQQIYQHLQTRKMKFIQKHADISNETQRNVEQSKSRFNRARFVDIIQE